jgi:hypothetical protein
VAVYYRDHLVQAIKLVKVVAAEEERPIEAGSSEVEFSRTEKFTNLETLPKRALSIAVNQTRGSVLTTQKCENP